MRYFILFVLIPACGASQKKDSLHTSILKLNLTSLIDGVTFPRIEISAEHQLKKNISLTGELGYQFYPWIAKPDTNFIKPSGIKASVQLRRYFIPGKSGDNILDNFGLDDFQATHLPGFYAGLEFFYRYNKTNQELLYRRPDDTTRYTDCFTAAKSVFGTNLVLGLEMYLSDKVVLDVYGGLGIIYRRATNNYREYNYKTDTLQTGPDFNFGYIAEQSYLPEGNGLNLNITLGMRLGIKL